MLIVDSVNDEKGVTNSAVLMNPSSKLQAPSANKQSAVTSAGEMALKMYMKSQMGGGGGGAGGLMGMMSKFM